MAMAMCTLQSSSISSLCRLTSLIPGCDEAACAGISFKGCPPGVISGGRRGSGTSLRRLSPRWSAQRDDGSVQLCFGENEDDWQWSAFESSRVTGRRECLLAMAVVGVLISPENARAEEFVESAPKTEAVNAAPKIEAVNAAPKIEAVNAAPKTEAVNAAPKTEIVDAPSLELYVDEKEGFKLLRPALWNKVEKAGATVLFEDPAKRGNTIGVVVNPVRISSLKDFGTPDVVAEKLLAAERKKPSTNDAQLVRVQERQANGDIPLYCLEYTLDSSRGQKRILSAVTVASKKLYILNITYVDSAATPAPPAMAEAFTQVLNSFDLVA